MQVGNVRLAGASWTVPVEMEMVAEADLVPSLTDAAVRVTDALAGALAGAV